MAEAKEKAAALVDQTYSTDHADLRGDDKTEVNKRVPPLPAGTTPETVGEWPRPEGRMPAVLPADTQGTEDERGGVRPSLKTLGQKKPNENEGTGLYEAGFGDNYVSTAEVAGRRVFKNVQEAREGSGTDTDAAGRTNTPVSTNGSNAKAAA